MSNESIEQVSYWVHEYWQGYLKYMNKYRLELFNKFHQNLHPPQKIGGGIMVGRSARNTDEDHAEILRVTKEFCEKYENPINFPKEF